MRLLFLVLVAWLLRNNFINNQETRIADALTLFKNIDFLPFRSLKYITNAFLCKSCKALRYPYQVLNRFFRKRLWSRFINLKIIPALKNNPLLLSINSLFGFLSFVNTCNLSTRLEKCLSAVALALEGRLTGISGYREKAGACAISAFLRLIAAGKNKNGLKVTLT